MAGAAFLLHLDPYDILVTIDAHLDDALGVPRAFPLAPQLPARAAVVPGLAGFDGAGERFRIHVGDHEHVARVRVGRDTDDEPVRTELGREREAFLELLGGAGRCKRRGPVGQANAFSQAKKCGSYSVMGGRAPVKADARPPMTSNGRSKHAKAGRRAPG